MGKTEKLNSKLFKEKLVFINTPTTLGVLIGIQTRQENRQKISLSEKEIENNVKKHSKNVREQHVLLE